MTRWTSAAPANEDGEREREYEHGRRSIIILFSYAQSILCSTKHVIAQKSNLVFGHWFHQAGNARALVLNCVIWSRVVVGGRRRQQQQAEWILILFTAAFGCLNTSMKYTRGQLFQLPPDSWKRKNWTPHHLITWIYCDLRIWWECSSSVL